ncbi:MAG: hypothetical protein CFE44_09810 [Burkholderiales bacterium PBB4]|nr:MAG: hypothetical protein CFE44_09810 [Burkholderiales bacterium PBB4]
MPLRALGAALLLTGAAAVSAQTMKPGLWEITTQMQSGGKDLGAAMAAMQKQMASMPPEQRKMMEDMMAKQGVQMSAAPGGGMGVKMCMTQEMVDRQQVAPPQQGDCTHTASPRTGNTMKFSFKCSKPASSGQGEVTFSSPEAYSSKVQITAERGGAERMTEINSSGKWLGSNCGDIKPIQLPAK